MTPDELRALRVEMAALCGWRLSGQWLTRGRTSIWLEPGVTELDAPSLPDYCNDWGAAGQVVEAMNGRGFFVGMCYQSPPPYHPRWYVAFVSPGGITFGANVETYPRAICLAARAALRSE